MDCNDFWKEFLEKEGLPLDTTYLESFHFAMTEGLANDLLHLVLDGVKKATSSSLPAYEIDGDRIPQVGDYSIVTDWDGNPKCVIRTTKVRVIPYKEMTYDICKLEGEDECLETWQKGHEHFFIEEGNEMGYVFTKDMPVVFEEFEVVYSKKVFANAKRKDYSLIHE